MKNKSHIRWTESERKRLVHAVRQYLLQNPHKSLTQALNKVQGSVLEKSRIRHIVSLQSISWLPLDIKELNKDSIIKEIIENSHPIPKKEEILPIKEEKIESQVPLSLEKIPTNNLIMELLSRLETKINYKIEKIENKLTSSINESLSKLNDSIMEKMEDIVNITQKTNIPNQIKSDENIKKKKILIVGLLAEQFHLMKSEFENIDLKLWSTQSDSIPKLRSMIGYIDRVIVMTKFISHDIDDIIKNSGVKYIRLNGGLSSIREILIKEV